MKRYGNAAGNSGIEAYEIGPDWIRIKFVTRKELYTYSNTSAGKMHVEKMKALARAGMGLSTYISQNVKDLYDEKRQK